MATLRSRNGVLMRKGSSLTVGCCCGATCNVIPRSLCATSVPVCGYPEFTAPAVGIEGDPDYVPAVVASCPPKFYRTKTVAYAQSLDYSFSDPGDEYGPPSSGQSTWTISGDNIYRKVTDGESGACIDTPQECSGSSNNYDTSNTMGDYTSSHFIYRTYDSACAETCSSGYDGVPDPECPGSIYGYPEYSWGFHEDSRDIQKTSIVQNFHAHAAWTTWEGPGGTITTTLSDEIPLHDTLFDHICDEENCDTDTDAGCLPCCTGDTNGRRFKTTPTGCVAAGSGSTAYENSPCNTSGTRSGCHVSLSLWFRDLVPGQRYVATITYLRCEIDNSENCTEITDTLDFTATDWAEVISENCSRCDILLKMCQLNDEATAWNSANPSETPRTVICSAGGFDVPIASGYYTSFSDCFILPYVAP